MAAVATIAQVQKYRGIPRLGCEDPEALAFVMRIIKPESTFRRWQMIRMAFNTWMYLGRQWIKPEDNRMLQQGAGTYHFRFNEVRRRSDASFKRPVTNYISKSVDQEVARITRQEYEPNVQRTTGLGQTSDPELAAASRMSKDLLLHDLRQNRWMDTREALAFDMTVTGTCCGRSWLDETLTDMVPISLPDARFCPHCDAKFGSDRVPASFPHQGLPTPDGRALVPMLHADSVEPVESEDRARPEEVRMTVCPYCPEENELEEYRVSREEAEGGSDAMGRPLGEMVPRSSTEIEDINPFELYIENSGVGVEPSNCKIWGQKTPRDLDWIAARLGEEAAEGIDRDDARELMRDHPILGDQWFHGFSGGVNSDPDIYWNHAAVSEVHVDPLPLPGLEMGRSFMVIKNRVYMNDSLVVEKEAPNGELVKIQRVTYAAARYRRIPRIFWGRTFVDDMISPQQRLNECDAQIADIRDRFSPFLAVPPGTEIHTKRDIDGGAKVIEFDASDGKGLSSHMFPGRPVTGNAYFTERREIVADLERLGFPQDVERGKAPQGIKTTTGLMHLSEEIAKNRAPRERALGDLYERLWTSKMELTWCFRQEEGEFERESGAGLFERQSYRGVDLLGQVKIRVKRIPGMDSAILVKEGTAEALGMHLYRADSQASINKLLENMSLPTNVNEEQAVQVHRAESAWITFGKTQEVEAIDASVDDHWIWWQILGKRWQEEENLQRLKEVEWGDKILPVLAGWERRLGRAEEMDAMQRAVYEGIPPKQWGQKYAEAQQLHKNMVEAINRQNEVAGKQGLPPTPPPTQQIPAPPEDGDFLPDATEVRIYMLWLNDLGGRALPEGVEPTPEAPGGLVTEELTSFLRIKARMEGHKLLHEEKLGAAAVGPEAAAPGGAQGPAGEQTPQGAQPQLPAGGGATGPDEGVA